MDCRIKDNIIKNCQFWPILYRSLISSLTSIPKIPLNIQKINTIIQRGALLVGVNESHP